MKFLPPLFVLLLGLLLGGCTTTDNRMDRGRNLKGLERFFVVTNLNDNHAIGHQIVEVLRQRGLTAETGPRTMMPEDAQAVITYRDYWAWDFGEHLSYLQLEVSDPGAPRAFATTTYGTRMPSHQPVPETIRRLLVPWFE